MVTINKQWIIKQLFFMAQLPVNSHIIQITRGKKQNNCSCIWKLKAQTESGLHSNATS